MKLLVYGTMFIGNPQRAELTEMWVRLNRFLYPDADLLLVDSQSDDVWCSLVPSLKNAQRITVGNDEKPPELQRGLNWITFPDNIGHLDHSGRDGWGRAFCRGLQIAVEQNYDYVLHIEADLLCRASLMPWLEQMKKHNLPVLTTPAQSFYPDLIRSYDFPEVGLMAWSVDYIRASDFIKRYNWPERTRNPLPEQYVRQLAGEDLFYKNLPGCRDDRNTVRFHDPETISYMTHVKEPEVYQRFMNLAMPQGWQVAA